MKNSEYSTSPRIQSWALCGPLPPAQPQGGQDNNHIMGSHKKVVPKFQTSVRRPFAMSL